jgi:hypothetical protein
MIAIVIVVATPVIGGDIAPHVAFANITVVVTDMLGLPPVARRSVAYVFVPSSHCDLLPKRREPALAGEREIARNCDARATKTNFTLSCTRVAINPAHAA